MYKFKQLLEYLLVFWKVICPWESDRVLFLVGSASTARGLKAKDILFYSSLKIRNCKPLNTPRRFAVYITDRGIDGHHANPAKHTTVSHFAQDQKVPESLQNQASRQHLCLLSNLFSPTARSAGPFWGFSSLAGPEPHGLCLQCNPLNNFLAYTSLNLIASVPPTMVLSSVAHLLFYIALPSSWNTEKHYIIAYCLSHSAKFCRVRIFLSFLYPYMLNNYSI